MATYLKQLRTKADVANKFVMKHGCTYYKQLLENNKQYIAEQPNIETCQELSKKLFYTRLASLPGRYETFWKEVDHLKQLIKNRQDLTVENLGIGFLFAGECYAWFTVGEILGRGHLIGYYP